MMYAMLEFGVVVGLLLLHTGVTIGLMVGIYRAQRAFNVAQSGRIEAAIEDVKRRVPDLKDIETRIALEVARAKPDLQPVEARITAAMREQIGDVRDQITRQVADLKAAIPPPINVEEVKLDLGEHLLHVFNGKIGAEVAAIKQDPDFRAAMGGGGGGNLMDKIMAKIATKAGDKVGDAIGNFF